MVSVAADSVVVVTANPAAPLGANAPVGSAHRPPAQATSRHPPGRAQQATRVRPALAALQGLAALADSAAVARKAAAFSEAPLRAHHSPQR